jgi:tRNA pseudouridine55 synthase
LADRKPSPQGVLVVDKPSGMTSHDVVSRVRRALGTKEVGHAGTLDPMATGVLVVMVGQATKLAAYLTADDKAYEARVLLGVATDSLDADGRVTRVADVPADWQERLPAALDRERARTLQQPPAVSAVHVDGERAHALVRRGEDVVLPLREVGVRALEVFEVAENSLVVKLEVGKGYYVRALARDLAETLGTVGHLTALRRVRSGGFSLEGAVPIDMIAGAPLVSIAEAARRVLPPVLLSDAGEARARVGKAVAAADRAPVIEGVQAWFNGAGALVAIAEATGDEGRVRRGFT